MRESAALGTNTLVTNGQIQPLGYEEQAASYGVMQAAAGQAATTETTVSGEQTNIAGETQQLASATLAAGQQAATGDFIAGALKGVVAIASLVMPSAGAAFTGIIDMAKPTSIGGIF